jgi:hypothetical protein
MFGLYVLHCPGNQVWRNTCKDRVFKVFGQYPISIQGFKPGHPKFDSIDLPMGPGSENQPLGHAGCVNGHRAILKHFLRETNNPYAFIFEDDVCFHGWVKTEHFVEAAKRVDGIDIGWDWMMLSAPYDWPVCHPIWIEGTQRLDNIYRCSQVSWGSHCFAVSRKGAQLLLERTTPFTPTFDVFVKDCEGAKVYNGPDLGCMPAWDTDCDHVANTKEMVGELQLS